MAKSYKKGSNMSYNTSSDPYKPSGGGAYDYSYYSATGSKSYHGVKLGFPHGSKETRFSSK